MANETGTTPIAAEEVAPLSVYDEARRFIDALESLGVDYSTLVAPWTNNAEAFELRGRFYGFDTEAEAEAIAVSLSEALGAATIARPGIGRKWFTVAGCDFHFEKLAASKRKADECVGCPNSAKCTDEVAE